MMTLNCIENLILYSFPTMKNKTLKLGLFSQQKFSHCPDDSRRGQVPYFYCHNYSHSDYAMHYDYDYDNSTWDT